MFPKRNGTQLIVLNNCFHVNKTSTANLYQNIIFVNTNIRWHSVIFSKTLHCILYTVLVAIWISIYIYCIEIAVRRETVNIVIGGQDIELSWKCQIQSINGCPQWWNYTTVCLCVYVCRLIIFGRITLNVIITTIIIATLTLWQNMVLGCYSGTDLMLRNITNQLRRIFVWSTQWHLFCGLSDWRETSCSGETVVC